MFKAKVYSVIGIQKIIFIVFSMDEKFWQFRLINTDGVVSGEQLAFYTPESAVQAGRKLIQLRD